MAVIKPTLTIVGNASTASSCPGPLSMALNLTAQPNEDGGATGCYGLAVDRVNAETITVSTTEATILDGSTMGSDGAGGTIGGYIYVKNITGSTRSIHLGIIADDGSAADLTASGDVARIMTLKDGEFAFFPWDYTMDLTVDADGAGTLEYWLFDRA
tara:strand:+ start:162 stop:632 length:471 start_codon:yes stop_codon:yes gene_type:complete